MNHIERCAISPGDRCQLDKFDPRDDGGLSKADGERLFEEAHCRFLDLAELLYADGRFALLVVLQGMDTSGKDSATRAVFSGASPTGLRAVSFKAPNGTELRHDFLWRVHRNTPAAGEIGIFNRSHYEDVLIVRVKGLVPKKRWTQRYDHINAFEELLYDEGTRVVKLFLHISKDYQAERLRRRLERPDKHWKFDPADLVERARWDDYQSAYEDALARCSTKHSPWYIIPAEKRWYRDLLVTQVLVHTLEQLDLRFPKLTFDPATIRIDP